MNSRSENINRIKKVVDYIESHIKDDLSLEDISKSTALSKYHLHRIFRSVTNKSLMDYVRGRKLTHSMDPLLNSNLNIIDIALEYNFGHEQSYIRSFKNTFNISPARFRKEKKYIPTVDIIDTGRLHAVAEGIVIQPYFVDLPEFSVIGVQHWVNHKDNWDKITANRIGLDFYYNKKSMIKNLLNSNVYMGLVRYKPGHSEGNYYIPSAEVACLDYIPEGMVGCTLPKHRYAVFKYIGFHPGEEVTIHVLSQIYYFIFCQWLPKSSEKQSDFYHFEKINLEVCRDDYCEVDIFVPI